jgi:hypothetical protein
VGREGPDGVDKPAVGTLEDGSSLMTVTSCREASSAWLGPFNHFGANYHKISAPC